jgi:hypothetical protein
MDEREIRMRCVEQAAKLGSVARDPNNLLDMAQKFYKYVKDGTITGKDEVSEDVSETAEKSEPEGKKSGKLPSIFR